MELSAYSATKEISGSVARTLGIVLSVAAASTAAAQWDVQSFGSGMLTNAFDVKVGNARNDGTHRVYVSERNGRVIEWTYTEAGWTNQVVASVVTNLALLAIGAVRGDGSNRLYFTEFRTNGALHEAQWTGDSWRTSRVDKTYQSLCLFMGAGRADGVKRLYVGTSGDGSTARKDRGLWEYTCVTGAWSRISLHTNGMEGSGVVADLHNDGTNRVLANSSVLDEMTWNGSSYSTSTIDHTSPLSPDPTSAGQLHNDGLIRVIINGARGKTEYSYGDGAWSKNVVDNTVTQRGDVFVGRLKADGLYRVYASYSGGARPKGPVREFTWNPETGAYSTSVVVDAISGAAAKLAAGNGRNDGVARLYAPDYAGGRVLEITSTNPFTYAFPSHDLRIAGVDVANGDVVIAITNLTAACEYSLIRGATLAGSWSNAAIFMAAFSATNWSDTNVPDRAFYRVIGRSNE